MNLLCSGPIKDSMTANIIQPTCFKQIIHNILWAKVTAQCLKTLPVHDDKIHIESEKE